MLQQPNPTLYVKNIDWKIKKSLLKRALYSLFTRHGKVLEIVALRKDGLRGQAFIIMEDAASATAALQAENGFTFFGKDLVIEYAKEKSDRIAKRDGTYVPKARRQKVQRQEESKVESADESETEDRQMPSNSDETSEQTTGPGKDELVTLESTEAVPPSKYLLALDLPAECNQMALAMLFQQYGGYREVRMPRPGLAFIEFDDEPHATLALQALNGFQLSATDALKLVYGKN